MSTNKEIEKAKIIFDKMMKNQKVRITSDCRKECKHFSGQWFIIVSMSEDRVCLQDMYHFQYSGLRFKDIVTD